MAATQASQLDAVLQELLTARGVAVPPGQSVREAASTFLADLLKDAAGQHQQLGSADSAQLLREVSDHIRQHQLGSTAPPPLPSTDEGSQQD